MTTRRTIQNATIERSGTGAHPEVETKETKLGEVAEAYGESDINNSGHARNDPSGQDQ